MEEGEDKSVNKTNPRQKGEEEEKGNEAEDKE